MKLCKTYITLPAETGRVVYVVIYDRVSGNEDAHG